MCASFELRIMYELLDDDSAAFKSQTAISMAEIAIEAIPERPRLRIRDTIAFQISARAIASRPFTTSARSLELVWPLPYPHRYSRCQFHFRRVREPKPGLESSTREFHRTQEGL